MFCIVMSLFATSAFAQQLKEVRGIQTRSVKYTEYYSDSKNYKERWGYEFVNENDYDVWLEIELKASRAITNYGIAAGIRATKSITLKAGEKYVWKCGENMVSAPESGYAYDAHEVFYIEYKAYKKE